MTTDTSGSGHAALTARGLRKTFGPKVAVDRVDLDVAAGSFFGIVGPNGAGKTTTLRMATGLLRPDGGHVHVEGVDVWADPVTAKRLIGVLPEDLALFERLSGRELLVFHGALRNMDPNVVLARAEELLELLGLTDAADTLVVDYSHGMRKKLVLAAALLHGPRLLFLDEPFEAIDPVSARAIRNLLGHFTATGSTIVFSSHVMELVERLCDHVAVMAHGTIAWSGPLSELRGHGTLEDAFVALVGEPSAPQELSWLANSSRLKLRLIRNGLRLPQYAVLFIVGTTGGATVALFGFASLAGVRHDPIRFDLVIVAFAAVSVMWTVVPLLGFGTDETLDPQRLALLPLTARQLVTGLFVAALVGVAPLMTALGLSGSIVGLAASPAEALMVALAVALTAAFCVAASRALNALVLPLLRSRRGRDLLVMTVLLAAVVPQSFRLFASDSNHHTRHTVETIADRVRFTPFGWGGYAASEAGRGHFSAATVALGAVALLTAALLVLWSRLIPRAFTTADAAAPRGGARRQRTTAVPLFGRALAFLPRDRMGATAAKELLNYVRDPRRRAPVIAALVVPALFVFSTVRAGQGRPASTTLLALVALLPASGLTLNQFGLDGAALWSIVVAGDDPRADLVGKNLATLVVVTPLVLVPAIVIAAFSNGWGYLPLTLGLVPGLVGIVLGLGNIVSACLPYALPDRHNPLAANPGQGCVSAITSILAIGFDVVLAAPVAVAVSVAIGVLPLAAATVIGVAAATLYGYAVWRLGLGVAVRHLRDRMPELLAAVSPRQAA